jgi:hypothetical protein
MKALFERRKGDAEQFWFMGDSYANILLNRYKLYQRRMSPMSIAITLIGKESIVLATDSCWSEKGEGAQDLYYRHDLKKLWRLSGFSGLAVTTNNVGYTLQLVELLNKKITQQELNKANVVEIAERFSRLANANLAEYVTASESVAFLVVASATMAFVFAGYDESKNPHIQYCENSSTSAGFLPSLYSGEYLIVGVKTIARYIIEKTKVEISKLSQTGLKLLATSLIVETSKIEPSVDDVVQMLVIPKEGNAYEVSSLELAEMKKEVGKYMQDENDRFVRMLKSK